MISPTIISIIKFEVSCDVHIPIVIFLKNLMFKHTDFCTFYCQLNEEAINACEIALLLSL